MSNCFNTVKTRFSLLLIVVFLFCFISCSQNVPDITYTNYSVIFTYQDNESTPEARLSVFLQNNSDVRRCERIKISSHNPQYVWETSNIKKISAGDYQWAGNVNFVVPKGEKIPDGMYEITYINADHEKCTTSLNLFYDKNIYDYTVPELLEKLNNKSNINLAIFDENNVLLYFGEKTEDLLTKGDIFNTYPEASFYQDILLSYDKTVICILPENKL